jgi:hypothetical protein
MCDFAITLKANPKLHSQEAVRAYVDQLVAEHKELENFKGVLADIVDTVLDYQIELFSFPDMEGEYISHTNGIRLLWVPDTARAALNRYQGGDWRWTDASSPEDALRRYREDDMME